MATSDNESLWRFRVVIFDSDDSSIFDVRVRSKDALELSRRHLPAAHCDLVNQNFIELD